MNFKEAIEAKHSKVCCKGMKPHQFYWYSMGSFKNQYNEIAKLGDIVPFIESEWTVFSGPTVYSFAEAVFLMCQGKSIAPVDHAFVYSFKDNVISFYLQDEGGDEIHVITVEDFFSNAKYHDHWLIFEK
jgi:hypothetical protein